jgi:hypothetical protein
MWSLLSSPPQERFGRVFLQLCNHFARFRVGKLARFAARQRWMNYYSLFTEPQESGIVAQPSASAN